MPFLSKEETPVEPIIYNIFSSLKSLFPYFDNKTFENCQRLSEILSDNRDNINNVNLERFKFCGSRFINTGFFLANYKEEGIDFTLADVRNADFVFGIFNDCNLSRAYLRNSNLCNVKFINMDENKTPDFTDANLGHFLT